MLLKLILALALVDATTCFSLGLRSMVSMRSARTKSPHLTEATPCIDPRDAPGDPSLILTTNVALKDKAGFVMAASAAVASCLSKPETYVAICVTDQHESMSFGGTTDPCALGCVYSIGQINQENNVRHAASNASFFFAPLRTCSLHTPLAYPPVDQNALPQAALTLAISQLLEEHGGVPNNRIYINFFDVPRANCGWSGRTFAG